MEEFSISQLKWYIHYTSYVIFRWKPKLKICEQKWYWCKYPVIYTPSSPHLG